MPNVRFVHFDTIGWQLYEETDERITWGNESGDNLSVYFFGVPPDISVGLIDVSALRNLYREQVSQAGGALISVDVISVNAVNSIRTLFKFPQQPDGMTYLASLTCPFAEFSYVVKVTCAEHGITGIRDSIVMDKLLGAGKLEIDEDGNLVGWFQDPYSTNYVAPLLRNQADDEDYDAEFPQHPLSRVRRTLTQLEATLTFDRGVRESKPFQGSPR